MNGIDELDMPWRLGPRSAVAYLYPWLLARLPSSRHAPSAERITYEDGPARAGGWRRRASTCADLEPPNH
jgi:hypothetical protein